MTTQAQKDRKKRYKQNKKAKLTVERKPYNPLVCVAGHEFAMIYNDGTTCLNCGEANVDLSTESKISLPIANFNELNTSPAPPNEILDAIRGVAGMVQELAQNTQIALHEIRQEFNGRIATVEQAQSEGLLTLGSQSGLDSLGYLGGGIPQQTLVGTHEFQDVKVDEHRILSEPGLDLPDPTDSRIVLVGVTTEAEKRRRQEALHGGGNQGGY